MTMTMGANLPAWVGPLAWTYVVLSIVSAVIITVGTLFMLMMMRMMLEFYLSNIRIAQSAQSIDERQAAGR